MDSFRTSLNPELSKVRFQPPLIRPDGTLAERRIPIQSDADIARARQEARELAAELNLAANDQTVLATAISELARNIVSFAESGEIEMRLVEKSARKGIRVVARDKGPGIPDPSLALTDGYSTAQRLGLGLPGVRRLVDNFELKSQPGLGTEITVLKWARSDDAVSRRTNEQ